MFRPETIGARLETCLEDYACVRRDIRADSEVLPF